MFRRLRNWIQTRVDRSSWMSSRTEGCSKHRTRTRSTFGRAGALSLRCPLELRVSQEILKSTPSTGFSVSWEPLPYHPFTILSIMNLNLQRIQHSNSLCKYVSFFSSLNFEFTIVQFTLSITVCSCTLPTEQASPVRQILFRGAMAPTLLPVRPGPHLTMWDFSECVIVIVIVIVQSRVPAMAFNWSLSSTWERKASICYKNSWQLIPSIAHACGRLRRTSS